MQMFAFWGHVEVGAGGGEGGWTVAVPVGTGGVEDAAVFVDVGAGDEFGTGGDAAGALEAEEGDVTDGAVGVAEGDDGTGAKASAGTLPVDGAAFGGTALGLAVTVMADCLAPSDVSSFASLQATDDAKTAMESGPVIRPVQPIQLIALASEAIRHPMSFLQQ